MPVRTFVSLSFQVLSDYVHKSKLMAVAPTFYVIPGSSVQSVIDGYKNEIFNVPILADSCRELNRTLNACRFGKRGINGLHFADQIRFGNATADQAQQTAALTPASVEGEDAVRVAADGAFRDDRAVDLDAAAGLGVASTDGDDLKHVLVGRDVHGA